MRTILLSLAFLISMIGWNYYNFMVPIILKKDFIELGFTSSIDTFIGIVMVLDNIVAIFMLPYFGVLSDRTKSKLGKRTPYIIIGTICAYLSFLLIGVVSQYISVAAFWSLLFVIMMFNISMAFYRTASATIMPEYTDPGCRSRGNAIVNIMGAVAMVIGIIIPTITSSMFDVETAAGLVQSHSMGFYLVSFIAIAALILFLVTIKETPTGKKFFKIGDHSAGIDPVTFEYLGEEEEKPKERALDSLKTIFTEKEKSTLYMLFVVLTWFFGYNAFETFYSLYATEYLGWTESSASLSKLLAPIVMVVSGVFVGKWAEKIGQKKVIYIGLIGLCVTSAVLIFLKTFLPVAIVLGVFGIFYGCVNINTIVVIWTLAPKEKIGTYTGAYYLFSQLSGTLSPVIAGGVFDLYKMITHCPEGNQYSVLFYYLIFWEVVAMIFLSGVKRGQSK